MALTLLEYAKLLDSRRDLFWPAAPEVEKPKAKPHLTQLADIRAITWSIYGTLLSIVGGEVYFEHPTKFIMDTALDKTIQEFKMWASMVRRPGSPTDYLRLIYGNLLMEHRMTAGGTDKNPETLSEKVWEGFIKKLLQKDYKFDAGLYGSLNEFSKKVAYFFHASLQGTACYPGAVEALKHVKGAGILQGLLADSQCFTLTQLQRGFMAQAGDALVEDLFEMEISSFSHELRVKKPSDKLFRHTLAALGKRGIEPNQVLHIGSKISLDVIPAKRLGMKTALFAGDKASLEATPEQFKEPTSRPDLMLTELNQIADVVS